MNTKVSTTHCGHVFYSDTVVSVRDSCLLRANAFSLCLSDEQKMEWRPTQKGREDGMCLHAQLGVSSQCTFPGLFCAYRALPYRERNIRPVRWRRGGDRGQKKDEADSRAKRKHGNWTCERSSTPTCSHSLPPVVIPSLRYFHTSGTSLCSFLTPHSHVHSSCHRFHFTSSISSIRQTQRSTWFAFDWQHRNLKRSNTNNTARPSEASQHVLSQWGRKKVLKDRVAFTQCNASPVENVISK